MTDKECNENCDKECCCNISDNYDDIGDSYDIERLEDIIQICEFLIQTKKHKIQKRKVFKDLLEENEEENKEDNVVTNIKKYPCYVYRYTDYPYRHRIPWWDRVWF